MNEKVRLGVKRMGRDVCEINCSSGDMSGGDKQVMKMMA